LAITISLKTTPHRIHAENVFNFAPIREVALLFIGIFATMVPALNYLSYHANDPAINNALNTPGQFYFSSGALSSVLDNAPTYVTFLEAELGKLDKDEIAFISDIVRTPQKDRPTDNDLKTYIASHPELLANPDAAKKFSQNMSAICETLAKYHGDNLAAGTLTNDQIKVGMLLGEPRLNWYIIAISLGSVFFGAMTYIGNGPNFMVKSIAENAGAKCPSFFGYVGFYSIPILLPILILVWLIFLFPHR
jgi:Na+/H+ antiporter NhaD/arsenite permease-like protein